MHLDCRDAKSDDDRVASIVLSVAGPPNASDGEFVRLTPTTIKPRDGGLCRTDEARGESYTAILQRAGREFVEVEGSAGMPLEMRKYSMASYGAQFCEVRVKEESGEVRPLIFSRDRLRLLFANETLP